MPHDPLPSFVLHDMGNAVSAITGVAETLDIHRDRLSAAQLDALVDGLKRQAQMLGRLLGDLADLRQLEAGAFSVALQPVAVLDAVVSAVSQVAPAGGVHVRVPPELEVLADPDRLHQVLVNLLTNARVHGGPTTWVDASRAGTTASIAVSDDGDGLEPALAAAMFERYRRGPQAAPRSGTGLGLSIVRGLTRAFGGDTHYVRRPRGSQFVIEVQALEPHPPPATSGSAHDHGPRAPFDHAAVFYDDHDQLEGEIARLVTDGLDADEAVVVLATPQHWSGTRRRLVGQDERVRHALASGQLLVRDAATTLRSLHTDGRCDPDRFARLVEGLVAETTERWGGVRVFGEMVALLWDAGDVLGALALEDLWNDLHDHLRFGLLCGYPRPAGDDHDLERVCDRHGFVFSD